MLLYKHSMQRTHSLRSSIASLYLIFLSGVCFFTGGCGKKNTDSVNHRVIVEFSTPGIDISAVDSARVTFLAAAGSNAYSLSRNGQVYESDIPGLKNGIQTMIIYVFTPLAHDGHPGYYEFYQQVNLDGQGQTFRVPGPTGDMADDWGPVVILEEGSTAPGAVVSVRPTDATIGLDAKQRKWNHVYIRRTAVYQNANGQAETDSAKWDCTYECLDAASYSRNYRFDIQPFWELSQRMKGRNWLSAAVDLRFRDSISGEQKIYSYEYIK